MSDEESRDKNHRASDYRLTTVDDQPALELPNGDTVVLRLAGTADSLGDDVRAEIEYDAANDASWFDVYEVHDGMHDIHRVSIQPEVDGE